MKYRKPSYSIKDRHVLIELDMDRSDERDFKHILRKAYLNHKAPHEYDDVKRYIRDIVFGKHNSVYIMNNGNPNPLASAFVLGSPYLTKNMTPGSIYYDFMSNGTFNGCYYYTLNLTNNSTNCNSSNAPATNRNAAINLLTYGYNNGTALQWGILYLPTSFNQATSVSASYLLISPTGIYQITNISPKYAYAPYVSSANPLTLSAYYYWENSTTNTINESYTYFGLLYNYGQGETCGGWGTLTTFTALMPLFYTQGSFSFSASTYYLSMWQWTYQ